MEASGRYEESDDHPESGWHESLGPVPVLKPADTNSEATGFPIRLEAPPVEIPRLYAALEGRMWERMQSDWRSREGGIAGCFTLGITSAVPGEGKTTIALHLALHIARNTFNRVCLIDLSLGEDELS